MLPTVRSYSLGNNLRESNSNNGSINGGARSIKSLLEAAFNTNTTKDATVPIRIGALAKTAHELRESDAARDQQTRFSSKLPKSHSSGGLNRRPGTSSGSLVEAFSWIGGARGKQTARRRDDSLTTIKIQAGHGTGKAVGNLVEEPRHQKKNDTRASNVDFEGRTPGVAATVVRRISPSTHNGSPRKDNTRRFNDRSARVRNTVDVSHVCHSVSPMSMTSPSRGGYAFSCDPQAQGAEIAMILSQRPATMSRPSSFNVQRPSLYADQIVCPRNVNLEGAVDGRNVARHDPTTHDPTTTTQFPCPYSFDVSHQEAKDGAEEKKGSSQS